MIRSSGYQLLAEAFEMYGEDFDVDAELMIFDMSKL